VLANFVAKPHDSPGDPESSHDLHYWQKIKAGETRIFTLTSDRLPVATLEYCVDSRAILHIEGRNGVLVDHGQSIFLPLCAAIHAIRKPLALTDVDGLPGPLLRGIILTRRGTFEVATNAIALAIFSASATFSRKHT
jgi:hypothetical protein